jgi:hypothetical protein
MKLFQIHSVLTEIKESLRSGRPASAYPSYTSPQAVAPVPSAPQNLHSMASGDEMLRALDAQMKWDETTSNSETR